MQFYSKKTLLTALPVMALAFAGCDDDDETNGSVDLGPGVDIGTTDLGGGNGLTCAGTQQDSITVGGETITDPTGAGRPFCIFNAAGAENVVDQDMDWTPAQIYILTGTEQGQAVSLETGNTLNIAAGTTIYAEGVPLVIRPGAMINVNGSETAPVTITSINRLSSSVNAAPGDHGGLVVAGNAPANCGVPCSAEAELPDYGGNDPLDNSGTIRYLRIEFGGFSIDPENQLNGLSLYAVGAGTTIEYVHIHRNFDDGIEWFGGTVDAKYLLITGCEDDSLDWTDGWTGRAQYVAVQQWPVGATEHGIEADSNGDAPDTMPRSAPVFSNMTIVVRGDHTGTQRGMLLRRGTGGQFWNSIVVSENDTTADDGTATLIEVRDPETLNNQLAFQNDILHPNIYTARDPVTPMEVQMVVEADASVTVADTMVTPGDVLIDPINTMSPNLGILTGGPADGYMVGEPGDSFFDTVNFIGAIDPNDDWTMAPWISYPTGAE